MNNKKIQTYRYQLFPSVELLQLVGEAVKVSPNRLISELKPGWFPRLVRVALTCYIAYCKTLNHTEGK